MIRAWTPGRSERVPALKPDGTTGAPVALHGVAWGDLEL
jgi:hypothetical protein